LCQNKDMIINCSSFIKYKNNKCEIIRMKYNFQIIYEEFYDFIFKNLFKDIHKIHSEKYNFK